jgi:hypothetical protein
MAITTSSYVDLKAIEDIKVSLTVFLMFPMTAVPLADRDQNLFFHSPLSKYTAANSQISIMEESSITL